jgi:putative transposase
MRTANGRDDGTGGFIIRAYRFALDPSAAQERLLRSYCGAARFAYNWALREVTANLETRKAERAAGVPEGSLTPAVSWSAYALSKRWNAAKHEAAPWWREVSMHAFRSGITACAEALTAWKTSQAGTRKGRRVGFPKRKTRRRSRPSVTFVELNHQLSWLHPDRHHVRLMLPAAVHTGPGARERAERLGWIHTHSSTRRLYRLVETGRATIAEVTISRSGGRWWVSLVARVSRPIARPRRRLEGAIVGVDVGLKHLATLSRPVAGLTDAHGHVANPRPLQRRLGELARLDRALARTRPRSANRRRLLHRRARLHGAVAETRRLALHRLTRELAAQFAVVVVEDLRAAGRPRRGRRRRLGRAVADAGLAQVRRQLAYKTGEHDHQLVVADRTFPSSKTCSSCGTAKAKLELRERTFTCDHCGLSLDRDINAARTLEREGARLLAGLRPESRNGDPRPGKTPATPGHRSSEGTTPPPAILGGVASAGDGALATAHGRQQADGGRTSPPAITPCCRT